MVFRGIRTTTRVLPCLLAGAIAAFGCGVSKSQVREAHNSGYATDFALVYDQALAEVRERYPNLSENATTGVIKTSWHEVRINQNNEDPPKTTQRSRQPGLFEATTAVRKLYFVRFTVRVLGGNPWRVSVVGQASEWDRAAGVPSELKGGNEPPWLKGRTDALQVAIHQRLSEHAVVLASTSKRSSGQAETTAADPGDDVDGSQFDNVPAPAAALIGAVLEASKSRDFKALEATMASEFVWSLGADPGAREALIMWQADSTILGRLVESIEAGCRLDSAGKQVSCPPAHTEQPGYVGHRVGFEPGGDGAWKMVFFVAGD